MQSGIVAMKMLSAVLVIFLLSGIIEAQDHQEHGKHGEIVQGSVRKNDVLCREGETLRECCHENCEGTCHRPNIHGSSGASQNLKSSPCLATCLCKQNFVRGIDDKCIPVSQCPGRNGQ